MKNRSRFTVTLLFVLFIAKGLFAQNSNNADAVLGVFKSPEGNRTMEIYKDHNQYFGKLTADNGDIKSGTVLLKNFSYLKDEWDGKIYIPARGADYSSVLTLSDPNTLKIKVKAGMMSKTKIWKREQ